MPKRPLHVLTLASGLICAGSLALVGRSFFRVDVVGIPVGNYRAIGVTTFDGRLELWNGPGSSCSYSSYPTQVWRRKESRQWSNATGIRPLGFGWGTFIGNRFLILPLWLVPILTAILPVRWWGLRRSRSHTRGFAIVEAPVEKAQGN